MISMTPTTPRRSRVTEIADDLRAQIESEQIAPGTRLPSTRQLAEQYEVGEETIRLAIARLKTAGIVRAHQGKGVFAQDKPPLKRNGMDRYDRANWLDKDDAVAFVVDRISSGEEYKLTDQVNRVDPDFSATPEIAAALGLAEGARVVARSRLVKDSRGNPTHELTSYYRPEHVEGTRVMDPTPGPAGKGGGFRVLHENGLPPEWLNEELLARLPTQAEANRLRISTGQPVVELHRTTATEDGTVIEYAVGLHIASRFTWSYRFRFPDSNPNRESTPDQ